MVGNLILNLTALFIVTSMVELKKYMSVKVVKTARINKNVVKKLREIDQ